MFALSQLVDIPHLFSRLDALPRELATARQELWAANIQAGEASREYNQHLDSKDTAIMAKEAWGRLLTFRDEQALRQDNLANLLDEMSALRKKIDLITALTMGCQETTESVLLKELLEKVRGVSGQIKEAVQEVLTVESAPLGRYEAGEPVPWKEGDPLPF